jgi:hypothetical protein
MSLHHTQEVTLVFTVISDIGQFFNSEVFGWMPDPVKYILMILIGAGILVVTGINAVEKVPQGSLGMKTRLRRIVLSYSKELPRIERNRLRKEDKDLIAKGRLPKHGTIKYLPPGWRLMVPYLHNIVLVDVTEKSIQLDTIYIEMPCMQFKAYRFSQVSVTTQVESAFLWKYANTDVMAQLRIISNSAIDEVLRDFAPIDGRISELPIRSIEASFLRKVTEKYARYGAKPLGVELGNPEPVIEGWLAQAIVQSSTTETRGLKPLQLHTFAGASDTQYQWSGQS